MHMQEMQVKAIKNNIYDIIKTLIFLLSQINSTLN